MREQDYSQRDKNGIVVFYVPLWKRNGITLQMFDDYWSNVHGPVCARLPGQHQYWQFHVDHDQGGIWPQLDGINYKTPDAEQFDGIAELTFRSDDDRKTWFEAAGILMDDEHNIFSQAIGINTSEGNSETYVDGIKSCEPNGVTHVVKLHVTMKQAEGVSVSEFREYLKDFSRKISSNKNVLKLRLHLFEEVDNTRPPAAGVSHAQPKDQQFQAAMEIAFENRYEMELFFASTEYKDTEADQAKFIRQISVFPERTAFTFVYDNLITLAGLRGSMVAGLIKELGAINQVKDDIINLMLKNEPHQLPVTSF
jgi:hypothetical protein